VDAGNWISLAAIAITLLNTWFKDWLERRRANRDSAQPRRSVGRAISWFGGWFAKPLVTYIILLSSLTISVIFLAEELSKSDPITRRSVFNISYQTALITSYLLFGYIQFISDGIHKILRSFIGLSSRQEDTSREINQLLREFVDLSFAHNNAITELSTIVHTSLDNTKDNRKDGDNKDTFFYG
jgi:hypothetical protein